MTTFTKGVSVIHKRVFIRIAAAFLSVMCLFSASAEDRNAITLIEQQDRQVVWKQEKDPAVRRRISSVTGLKSNATYLPMLIELNNENGGVYVTSPSGISEASVIYEYQTNLNGQMGLCALFQDSTPTKVGPIGNASVGGLLVQAEWGCPYVYSDIPAGKNGEESELGYSIRQWMDSKELSKRRLSYPGKVSSVKAWKRFFAEDVSMITEENLFVDASGLRELCKSYDIAPTEVPFRFLSKLEVESEIPVKEVDIRSSSRVYSSGFVYDDETETYKRWVGIANQYGDSKANEQLQVANVIIQRVNYTVSNSNMAPVTVGHGNADIFMLGRYIEAYWVRESAEDRTRFYDCDGKPIALVPGVTFVSLQSNSTAVVILNY